MNKNKVKIYGGGIARIALVCLLLAGCGNSEGYASMPFTYSEIAGSSYDDAVKQLKEAGFTNIVGEPVTTYSDRSAGNITNITVDGKTLFSKTSYPEDTEIVIKYYELIEKEPEETETETAAGEQQKEYTADAGSLKELAEDLFGFDYDNLNASYDDVMDEAFVISYRITEPLDISTFVNQNINRYIHYCQRAYEIDGVDRVRFDVQLLGQDQYGQDYEITGLQEIMTRETFGKYNWSNLDYQNIWETFNDECYYFGVAPEIISEVDTDKIFYDSFERDGKIQ